MAEEVPKRLSEPVLPGIRFKDLQVAVVDPKSLVEIDKNARFMTHKQFKRLTENIREDGYLSSVPLCYRDGDKWTVLSGNHRVKAAVAAGVEKVLVLFHDAGERTLSLSEIRAKQLSHNELSGQDDLEKLAEIWQEIEDLQAKLYSGLSDEKIQKLDALQFQTLGAARPDLKYVLLCFLPEHKEMLEQALQEIGGQTWEEMWLAGRQQYEPFLALLKKSKKAYNVKNLALAFDNVLRVYRQVMIRMADDEKAAQEQQGEEDGAA